MKGVTTKSDLTDWRYELVPGHWDEAFRPSRAPRSHWRKLAVAIGRMGREQFDRRWQTGRALIQANGISYNVYGDPAGTERPWPMDPVPLIINADEWAGIERAIIQRASLLNAMCADLYGPQTLLSEHKLPPELVFANPNFLRPAFGIELPHGMYLHSYAADLARNPDGRWWVLADRTQAPSGSGYALENRIVSARTLMSIFSQTPVRQLARYFQAKRDGLRALAPRRGRIVLLTPGPANETYFEHSYLAKYWGFPLVEGADLTVRDSRVFIKTLGGLEPVDLILRREDDEYCDPLELRGDSLLGVPGLLQAVRSGNVVIANALGSGLVETPAHMAFLPSLCREMLGQELAMPSVATWWCGQEAPRRYVLDHIEELVIKPAFPRFGQDTVFGADITEAQREELKRRIEARPEQFVAQEKFALSSVPVWSERGLTPRHAVLRVFAAWDGEKYAVMPGGLTRISKSSSSLVVSMQSGGGSKDTWVLGAGEEPVVRRSSDSLEAGNPLSDLPSRVGDNLFWLGRYAERVESMARLARVLLPALSGEEDFGHVSSLETAIHILSAYGHLPAAAREMSIGERHRLLDRALTMLIHDPSGAVGLGRNLKHVRRVAWQLKERLSADTWRVLQQLEPELATPVNVNSYQRMLWQMNLLDRTITTLSAFAGLLMESTTRGHGWRFLDIGRRLERALQMMDLLKHCLVAAPDETEPYLDILLQIADSSITYRSRYLTNLRADLVLDLILADESNPRAIAFQVTTLATHIDNLPERGDPHRHPLESRLVLKALTSIRLASPEDLSVCDEEGRRPRLADFLDGLRDDLLDLSDSLTAKYLSHVTPTRLNASN